MTLNIKRTLLALCCMMLAVISYAYDFKVDGIYYNIVSSTDNTCSVTYKDKNYNSYSGNVIIPNFVNYNSKKYTVKSFSEKAFYGCSNLKKVVIPDSIESIGDDSWKEEIFYDCPSLDTLIIQDGNNSLTGWLFEFNENTKLKYVYIGRPLKNSNWSSGSDYGVNIISLFDHTYVESIELGENITLPSSCFKGCKQLSQIIFNAKSSIASLGSSCFEGCTALQSIDMQKVELLSSSCFKDCTSLKEVKLPKTLTDIPSSAFQGCSSLVIDLPIATMTVNDYAFDGCSSIEKINIPAYCTSIATTAFNGCTGLKEFSVSSSNQTYSAVDGVLTNYAKTSIIAYPGGKTGVYEFPSTITTIGQYAFRGCALTSLSIPSTVKYIYDHAFMDCSNLKDFKFEDTTSTVYFSYTSSYKGEIFKNTPLENVYIGRPLSGNYYTDSYGMFYNNTSLKDVTVGSNITSLYSSMFYGCTNLTSVSLPETLTTISTSAFQGCSKLPSITLPAAITSIGDKFLYGCTDLKTINSKIVSPMSLQNTAFYNIDKDQCKLIVPVESVDTYSQTPGWMSFNNIVAEDDASIRKMTISINDGGTVSVLGNTLSNTSFSASVKEGDDVFMTFTPNEGYELKSLVVNGEDVTSNVKDNSYTITSVNQDMTIAVTFAELPVYLTIKSADNGYIAQEVEKGKTYSFTITPSDGWQIESVSFNGTDVTSQLNDNKYTTPAITTNSELNVVYKQTELSAVKAVGQVSDIKVSASYGTLSIDNNGNTTNVSVFTLDGSQLVSERIGAGTTTIELSTNKVYIVKVGGETFKVAM